MQEGGVGSRAGTPRTVGPSLTTASHLTRWVCRPRPWADFACSWSSTACRALCPDTAPPVHGVGHPQAEMGATVAGEETKLADAAVEHEAQLRELKKEKRAVERAHQQQVSDLSDLHRLCRTGHEAAPPTGAPVTRPHLRSPLRTLC